MSSELIAFEDKEAVFAPQFLGSTTYYAMLALYGKVYIDKTMNADKRFKTTHRCKIVDTRDEIFLTVPISHPHGRHTWNDTLVSTHGKWWNKHLTALESAYGRTPFFEYYIDRFAPIFQGSQYENGTISISMLDIQCDKIIREILGFSNEVKYAASLELPGRAIDLRHNNFDNAVSITKYYQIRADLIGFRADQSIVDLIFNMGPEAPLVLRKMALGFIKSSTTGATAQ